MRLWLRYLGCLLRWHNPGPLEATWVAPHIDGDYWFVTYYDCPICGRVKNNKEQQ